MSAIQLLKIDTNTLVFIENGETLHIAIKGFMPRSLCADFVDGGLPDQYLAFYDDVCPDCVDAALSAGYEPYMTMYEES